MADLNPNLITFHQAKRLPKCPSPSARCLKVETFFRVTGLKYQTVCHGLYHRSKKANNICPYIESDETEISGADQIVKEISEKFTIKIDDDLTADQRVSTRLLEFMLTHRTYHFLDYFRSEDPIRALKLYDSFHLPGFFSRLPKFIANFSTKLVTVYLKDEVNFFYNGFYRFNYLMKPLFLIPF